MAIFVDRLLAEMENERMTVLASPEGYRVDIDLVIDGESEYFDVLAYLDNREVMVRIYPLLEEIVPDDEGNIFYFHNPRGMLLDYDGRETGCRVIVALEINMQVTKVRQPCGWLTLWHPPEESVRKETQCPTLPTLPKTFRSAS